jgi:hypothetical protein
MGTLPHDTANISIDCVLTKKGREFLSKNDGSFSIVKFALSDDEVDYTIIKQYGIDVGKEKIEKNTPVLEAITAESIAQKYKIVSVSSQNLTYVPRLTLVSSLTSNVLSLLTSGTSTVVVQQTIVSGESIDPELIDQVYEVTLNNRFLTLSGKTPDIIGSGDTVTYFITQTGTVSSSGGSTAQFTVASRAISTSVFDIYGTKNDKTLIRTFISVRGAQSGAAYDIEVNISQT